MEQQKNFPIEIRFANININKYLQYDLDKSFDKDKYPLIEFQSDFNFNVNPDKKNLSCVVDVKIVVMETMEIFSEISIEYSFDIMPFKDAIKYNIENNTYEVPDNIINLIISDSIGTTRGILFEKLKGTIAQKDVYPLINPSSLNRK